VAVLAVFCTGCVPDGNTIPVILHENPADAEETYGVAPLLAELGHVLESAESENGLSMSGLLNLSDMYSAHLPDNVVASMGGYLDLLDEVATSLRTLEKTSDAMSEALRVGNMAEAEESLEQCEQLQSHLKDLLPDVRDASLELISSLKREQRLVSSTALARLDDRLAEALSSFESLTEQYGQDLGQSRDLLRVGESLEQPVLELSVNDAAVWVGQPIHVSGSLTVGDAPIAGQEVEFLVDGMVCDSVTTDDSGCFAHAITSPAMYEPCCSVASRFVPQAEDALRMRGTVSREHVVTLRYHESSIDWSVDSALYPGLTGRISGDVRSLGAQAGRSVLVTLDGVVLGRSSTDGRGAFYCSFAVPPDVEPGEHRLGINVEDDVVRSIAPANAYRSAEVERLAPSVSIPCTPLLFVPGLPGGQRSTSGLEVEGCTLSVYGTVDSPLPLSAPSASLDWDDLICESSLRGESLELTVPPGRVRWVAGPQVMNVSVVPEEPWHRPAKVRIEFFVVNLYILGGGLAALCALAAVVVLRRRQRLIVSRPVMRPADRAMERRRAGLASPSVRGTHRDLVLGFYYRAAAKLQRATGVEYAPEMTLREFFGAVRADASTPARLLGRLTELAESALYGSRKTPSSHSRLARRLSIAIRTRIPPVDTSAEGETP